MVRTDQAWDEYLDLGKQEQESKIVTSLLIQSKGGTNIYFKKGQKHSINTHEDFLSITLNISTFKKGPGCPTELLVLHCKMRHVGKQTWVRGNEAARQGSAFGRGVGGCWGGGWRAAGGLDGQLRNSAEAELSLKNGAWPISKGQSPEH